MSFDLIKKYLVLLGGAGLLVGCVGEVDMPYPTYPDRYVLNGILNPDSVISVTLRKTLPPLSDRTEYSLVENARILCYYNGQRLGVLTYQKNGRYELPEMHPKAGGVYRIEAITEELTLSATDTVPVDLPFEVKVVPYEIRNPNGNPDIHLNFPDLDKRKKHVWLSFTNKLLERASGDTTRFLKDLYDLLQSVSPYLDDFNAEHWSGNLVNIYPYMSRIKPEFLGKGAVIFSYYTYPAAYKQPGTQLVLNVSSVSQAYDRYIKTAITALSNRLVNSNGALNNPFYEPTNVYSNVQNGLGILGSVNNRQHILVQN